MSEALPLSEMLPCPNRECPFPPDDLGTYDPTEGRGRYVCQGICPCGTRGPCERAETEDEAMELAILAWNALPRPLVWTSEPPGEGEPTWQYCEENHGVLLVPKFDPAVRCPHCVFFPVIKPPEPEGGE